MTMMKSSPFGLEDTEALLWEPSYPMADPMGAFLHMDEEGTFIERGTSPLSSSSSYSSPPLNSPTPSPPSLLLQSDKAEVDMLSLPWLSANELGHSHLGVNDCKEDAFSGLDWMAERVDLSEFDLDSLMGSCCPDEPPSSPEDLISSLECPMELDSLPLPLLPTLPTLSDLPVVPVTEPFPPANVSHDDPQEVHSPLPCVPEVQHELEIKSEPVSPAPSDPLPPPSPSFTLDLGSEVDVSESDSKPLLPHNVPQVPRIVLSLSPTRIILVLAPKEEVGVSTSTTTVSLPEPLSNSSSMVSLPSSPLLYRHSAITTMSRATRSKPYPSSKSRPHSNTPSPPTVTGKVKSKGGGPPKEKKLKKMEQNKTAATRYRQKKRVEQEALSAECRELEKKNQELEEKAGSLGREIEYLKELMEEVRLAKILKRSDAINV